MNMDRKTELKSLLYISNIIKLKSNDVSTLQETLQTSKVLSTKSNECSTLWRTTNPFIPLRSFSFILQHLVSEIPSVASKPGHETKTHVLIGCQT